MIVLDKSSFNSFITLTKTVNVEEDEIVVDNYKASDEFLESNGQFSYIFIKIQEIMKEYLKIEDLSFNQAVEVLKHRIFKISISNSFKNIVFWTISHDSEKMQWSVEYFSLNKIKSE